MATTGRLDTMKELRRVIMEETAGLARQVAPVGPSPAVCLI